MTGRLFGIASFSSLFLLLATTAMWVRSYRTVDEIKTEDGVLVFGRGNVALDWERFAWGGRTSVLHYSANWKDAFDDGIGPDPPTDSVYARSATFRSFSYNEYQVPVFGLDAIYDGPSRVSFNGGSFRTVVAHTLRFPHWIAAFLFSLLPLVWVSMRVRQFRRSAYGLCPVCGYDLRASRVRCPECGAAISRIG